MMKCSTSLWSADLTSLAAEIARVEPFTERFHLDVADGHYVPTMLFFPDLVAAIRKKTALPLEVHLMTVDPLMWIEPFAEAGADGFLFCLDSAKEPGRVIEAAKSRGKFVGASLLITEGLELVEPFLPDLDVLTIVGTAMGIKGASMDESVPAKVMQARKMIHTKGLKTEIEMDGGIRRDTVPRMALAGADWIVPGSLMFGGDPAEMRQWLASL